MESDRIERAVRRAASEVSITLKKEQEEVIAAFAGGRDVFVALPTGYGKSLCYGLLPRVLDILRASEGSIVMVVSPLLALMRDQVATFRGLGIPAVNASCCEDRAAVRRGEFKLVFISPESLFASLEWRRMLCEEHYRSHLVALVIDEAHCIKKWYVNNTACFNL